MMTSRDVKMPCSSNVRCEAPITLTVMGERLFFDPVTRTSWKEDGIRVKPQDAGTRTKSSHGVTLTLNLTSQCNLRCTYCYEKLSGKPVVLEAETARVALDEVPAAATMPLEAVHFFGGEPLLEFGLMRQIIHVCRTKHPDVSFVVSTNGTLLDKETATALKKENVRVIVSWDGAGSHRRHFDGTDSSEQVFDNLRHAAPILGGNLWVRMTITPEMTDLVGAIQKVVASGCRSFLLKDVSPGESGLVWRNQQSRRDLWDRLAEFYLSSQLTGSRIWIYGRGVGFTTMLTDLEVAQPRTHGCDCGITRLTVTADGKYIPCSRYGLREHTIGSVGKGLERGFSSRYCLASSPISCGGCFAKPICGGPCHAAAEQVPPECSFCAVTRHRVALAIWIRHSLRLAQEKGERQ